MTQNSDITRFVFTKALTDYFHGNQAEMALAIGCTGRELEQALSAEGIRIRAKIFELLAKYCAEHKQSIDALLRAYEESPEPSSSPSQPSEAD